ncbi:MAG: response regulator [Terriglobales bacterium]
MKRRILLVDDDRAVLLTLKKVLEMDGFEVETAESTGAAREKLDASSWHMVIADKGMEETTAGHDLIAYARQRPYGPAIAVLSESPRPQENSNSASLLVMPVNAQELVRQLEARLIAHEDSRQAARKAPAGVPPPAARSSRPAR